MPDHIHCFVRIGHKARLGLTVKRLREGITKCLRKEAPALQVWQPGFFDHLLRNNEEIFNRVKIMRLHGINRDIWDRFTIKKIAGAL